MKTIADTNVLLRTVLPDDRHRTAASAELAAADTVAISIPALCERVWALSQRHGTSRADTAATVGGLVAASGRPARPPV